MAKGIIAGFIGGAGRGTETVGKMYLADQLKKETAEADDLRARELSKSKETFVTSERLAGEEFKKGESKLERESRMDVAKTKASEGVKPTSSMKDAAELERQGYPKDVANAVAHGAIKQIKDEETGDMVMVNALNNKPIGRLTSSGGTGQKVWLPEGDLPENATVTKAHRAAARETASEKAGLFTSDKADFPGGRKQFVRDEAQRLANEERTKGARKPGIIDSAMNKPEPLGMKRDKAPQAAIDYVKKNPKSRQQFIDKYGYDPTK